LVVGRWSLAVDQALTGRLAATVIGHVLAISAALPGIAPIYHPYSIQ